MSIATLLQARVRASGAQPLVTHCTQAGRTELSATSLANAAAKIANALSGEWECEPGDAVILALPPHWQRACWLAGAWLAGLVVHPVDDPHDAAPAARACGARLIVVGTADAEDVLHSPDLPSAAVVAAVSLHPLGLPEPVPTGADDGTLVVRQQPDALMVSSASGDAPALALDVSTSTQDEILTRAGELARQWNLGADGRLRVDPVLTGESAWLGVLAVPLIAKAHAVIGSPQVDASERITSVAR